MTLEAIKTVSEAERECIEKLQRAKLDAKQRLAEAENQGKAALDINKALAEAEVRGLMAEAELAAARDTAKLLEKTGGECQILKSKAEGRLEKASALIVGKVVSG